jgi:hypothetical protein
MLTPFTTLDNVGPTATVIEVGPRSNFSTAFSTNAVSICQSCGLNQVTRLEKSRRYLLISTRCGRPPDAPHPGPAARLHQTPAHLHAPPTLVQVAHRG